MSNRLSIIVQISFNISSRNKFLFSPGSENSNLSNIKILFPLQILHNSAKCHVYCKKYEFKIINIYHKQDFFFFLQ